MLPFSTAAKMLISANAVSFFGSLIATYFSVCMLRILPQKSRLDWLIVLALSLTELLRSFALFLPLVANASDTYAGCVEQEFLSIVLSLPVVLFQACLSFHCCTGKRWIQSTQTVAETVDRKNESLVLLIMCSISFIVPIVSGTVLMATHVLGSEGYLESSWCWLPHPIDNLKYWSFYFPIAASLAFIFACSLVCLYRVLTDDMSVMYPIIAVLPLVAIICWIVPLGVVFASIANRSPISSAAELMSATQGWTGALTAILLACSQRVRLVARGVHGNLVPHARLT